MSQMWSSVQHCDITFKASPVLRLHPRPLPRSKSQAGWTRPWCWGAPCPSSSSDLSWTPSTKVPWFTLPTTPLLTPYPKSLWRFREPRKHPSLPLPRCASPSYVPNYAAAHGNVSAQQWKRPALSLPLSTVQRQRTPSWRPSLRRRSSTRRR